MGLNATCDIPNVAVHLAYQTHPAPSVAVVEEGLVVSHLLQEAVATEAHIQ